MKKLLSTILLISAVLATGFAAPKKGKSNSIKLDPKKKFAIKGVELGSLEWCQDDAKLNSKGELIWNKDKSDDWLHFGWELRGTDMSQYGALRIEISEFTDREDLRIEMANPASLGDATFAFEKDGICYVFFDGSGRWYGDMKNPDPKEGYEIRFLAKKANMPKTVIKSIELINKEDIPDASNLELLGVQFGTSCWQTRIIGNEITWPKGYNDGNAGWSLEGIDLSEYDRIRIEVESNDRTGLEISMSEKDGKNYHSFSNSQIQPGIYEADLSGEGYTWRNDDGTDFNKSEGLNIFLHYYNEKPSSKECHTVVKSVQLLKGKRQINENLKLLEANFGTSGWNANCYEGGIIEWIHSNDKNAGKGWNLKDIDLSQWDKILVELESTEVPVWLEMVQNNNRLGGTEIKPNVWEVKLDGSEGGSVWPQGAKWDASKKIDELQIRSNQVSKNGLKTKVKSVTLVKAGEGPQLPDRLLLNGAKLGSKKDSNSWIDENFAINWNKANYIECGWKVEKLEGDILEIKVTSTDVPLHLKIRELRSARNESEWDDDGSHIFRINLKTKRQITAKSGNKAPMWERLSEAFNFSEGAEIILLPANGVFKEGKKTVVEYIKVE